MIKINKGNKSLIKPLVTFIFGTRPEAIKLAPKLSSKNIIVVNSCGDSIKDKDIIKKKLGKYER